MNINNARIALNMQGPLLALDIQASYVEQLKNPYQVNADVDLLNRAYQVLMGHAVPTDSSNRPAPMSTGISHALSLPNQHTFDELVAVKYNLAQERLSLDHIDKSKPSSTYFQFDASRHFKQSFRFETRKNKITLSDITNGGIPGDEHIESLSFQVLDWGHYSQEQRKLSKVLKALFRPHFKTCTIGAGWHWGKVFNFTFNSIASGKLIDHRRVVYIGNHKFTQPMSSNSQVFECRVDGVTLRLIQETNKALNAFNPFTIEELFKPLNKEPKHWTRRMVVRAIANGQYTSLRRHAKDTSHESVACPITIVSHWATKTRNLAVCEKRGDSVYFSIDGQDEYSFTFNDLNRFPAINLTQYIDHPKAA